MITALLLWLALAPPPPSPVFLDAIRLHQAGRLNEAAARYRTVLAAEPANFEARSNLGAVLVGLGRYQEAITEYQQALKAAPTNTAVRLNLARAFYKAARLSEAIAELGRVRATKPGDVDAALLLAACHFLLGEDDQVIAVLQPLAVAQSDHPGLEYLLGTALIRQGRAAEGQMLVDRILRRGDSAEAHLMLGTAQLRGAQFSQAAVEFQRAIDLSPKLSTAHSLLGRAKLEAGDREAAAAAFGRALNLDSNDFEANFQLGVMLNDDTTTAEALPLLKRASELRPGSAAVAFQYSKALLAAGHAEAARVELERIVRQEPEFLEAHSTLATVYLRLGRKQDAERERQATQRLLSRPAQP